MLQYIISDIQETSFSGNALKESCNDKVVYNILSYPLLFFIFAKEMIATIPPLTPPSTSMENISESTDVFYNTSDGVFQEISGHDCKSEQSELESGSITDDCKLGKIIYSHVIIRFL